MATVRVEGVTLYRVAPPALPKKVRVYSAELFVLTPPTAAPVVKVRGVQLIGAQQFDQPTALAGEDQTGVEPWTVVELAGAATAADGATIAAWSWTQINGTPCVIDSPNTRTTTVKLPGHVNGETLTFALQVTDSRGVKSNTATVDYSTLPALDLVVRGGVLVAFEPRTVRVEAGETLPQRVSLGSLNTGQMSSSATWYPQMLAAGQSAALDEWRWSTLQPGGAGSALDATAVTNRQAKWQQFKDQGFAVKKVGFGLHYEPSWTFAAYPLGSANQDRIRFEGSDGSFAQADGSDTVDGVWSAVVRGWFDDYLTKMAAVIPFSEIDVIRITAGGRSELLYPEQPSTRYWAFADHVQNGGQYLAAGQTKAPIAGWDPANWTTAQRRTHVEWYIRSLVNAAVWQMNRCRALGFTGIFEIIMPGRGVTVSAYESDVSTGLPQSSTLARGVAWAKVAEFLPADPKIRLWASSVGQAGTTDANRIPTDADFAVAVDSTTANSWSAYRWIRFLAHTYGYEVGGENPGYEMGATAAFYTDLTSAGLLSRFFDEIAPPGASRADAADWAHADNFRTVTGLLDAYKTRAATVNT